jgi:hypothetical protein
MKGLWGVILVGGIIWISAHYSNQEKETGSPATITEITTACDSGTMESLMVALSQEKYHDLFFRHLKENLQTGKCVDLNLTKLLLSSTKNLIL